MFSPHPAFRSSAALAAALLLIAALPAAAQTRVRDICRLKGQEQNTLQGMGVVVGLKGTGDGDVRATQRALGRMINLMGGLVPQDSSGQLQLSELKDAKNVALVFITATVPAAGARQGDEVDCRVSAISAKSLEGGFLMMTPLLGPRPGDERIYGIAHGKLQTDGAGNLTTATIHNGARFEENFVNNYSREGKITLVIDRNHAGFQAAQDLAELINSQPSFRNSEGRSDDVAKALDQVNVEVQIPAQYQQDQVLFITQILELRMLASESEARVVINERAGTIVVGSDVLIGPVAISHRNLIIETGGNPTNPFVPVDSAGDTSRTRLAALVEALNGVKATTPDIIEIVKRIDRSGKLYGKLIIE